MADQQTPWTARQQNDPRADHLCQPTHTPVHHLHQQAGAVTTQAEHSRLKSGPPFMRRLGIHKNIPVSGTELTLGLQVGFIGSHLTVDKLIPDNPRVITGPPQMSFQLEAKSLPALIIKPRLALLCTWMILVGTRRPTSSNKC